MTGYPHHRAEYKERLDIRTPTVEMLVRSLSGGNQQKVVISKWLRATATC